MKIIIYTLLILLLGTPLYASDNCEIAWQVAQKAASSFKKDQAAGLRLFIQAQKFCPADAGLNYNLGMAYADYGRATAALPYLETAVKSNKATAVWRNNLASVLLQTGGDTQRALRLAKKAAQQQTDQVEIQLTLVEALAANGKILGAVRLAAKQKKQFSDNRQLREMHDQLLDRYLAGALLHIKQGEVEAGLAALQRADFSAQAAVVRAEVLLRLQRFDAALSAAVAGKQRFAEKSSAFSQVEDSVFAQMVRGFYEQFQRGDGLPAYAAAKELAEKYPQNKIVTKASSDLWEALLADAKTIEVPKPQQMDVNHRPTSSGQSRDLLAGIGKVSSGSVDAVDLRIDVDTQIPAGKGKRPYAIAVVIGNQNYQRQGKGIGDVRYAGRDAKIMKQYLLQVLGYEEKNIIYVLNASSGDLRNIFGTRENPKGRLHNYIRAGESEVFIYYVGHGAPGPDGKSAYLVPVDAQADYIANNGYPLDLFYSVIEKLPAKSTTVVMDACFSGDSPAGALFKNISPAMVKNINPLREVANTVVFSSADKDQVSTWYPAKRHSMFTYWFLKGLGGAADTDSDKSITAVEMETYLQKEVKYWAQREANRVQTPLMTGSGATVLAKLR